MKQNPWACLRAEFAIHHSRCALAFASHDTAKAHAYVLIERIAKPLRYCRIMLITQKCHGMDAGARSYRAMEGE